MAVDEDRPAKHRRQRGRVRALYPNRGSVSPDLWKGLIDRSKVQIDLLAFAASFLHDAVPDFADHLPTRPGRE